MITRIIGFLFQFLLLYFLGWTPLHEAAMHYGDGTQNILELLVSNGTDVNARANNGSTPLHDAMMFLPEECIKYLVINFFLSLVHHFKIWQTFPAGCFFAFFEK